MTKRLFCVRIEQEILVVADSAEDARDQAMQGDLDLGGFDYHANPMNYLPGDWDMDSIPYGARDEADPDRTIKGWLELGAAPNYTRSHLVDPKKP